MLRLNELVLMLYFVTAMCGMAAIPRNYYSNVVVVNSTFYNIYHYIMMLWFRIHECNAKYIFLSAIKPTFMWTMP